MEINWIEFRGPIGCVLGVEAYKAGIYAEYMERWEDIDLPVERKPVLLQIAPRPDEGLPAAEAVGYLRYSAGDETCPFFVIPGIGGNVTAFADCLPEPLDAKCWPGFCGDSGKITERVNRIKAYCASQELEPIGCA